MIVKGIVSSYDEVNNKAEVYLPEYDIVTKPLSIYVNYQSGNVTVGKNVLVVVFNNDFNDCLII